MRWIQYNFIDGWGFLIAWTNSNRVELEQLDSVTSFYSRNKFEALSRLKKHFGKGLKSYCMSLLANLKTLFFILNQALFFMFRKVFIS